jgi:hypothetical protein
VRLLIEHQKLSVASRTFVLLLGVGLGTSASSSAEATPSLLPQDAPHFAPGDNWTYLLTDPLSNKTRTFTQTVRNVRPDGSAVVSISPGGKSELLSPDGNAIPTTPGPHAPCTIVFHFPLKAGDVEPANCEVVDAQGLLWVRRAETEVQGEERVQTKAGTFATIKIRLTGTWSPQSGAGGGRIDQTIWYAPAVKRLVKENYQARASGKAVAHTEETELVRYAVKR